MDANAERVIARVFAVETPMPKAKSALQEYCSALVPDRAGDFAQALMDLGSAICTPKRPACGNCPWSDECRARKRGIQELLPVKAPKAARPLKRGAAFVVRDKSGAVLLVKRPEKGLLASMLQPPLGPWTETFPSAAGALKQAPFAAKWKKRPGIVRHGFTHFELEAQVYVAEVSKQWTTGSVDVRMSNYMCQAQQKWSITAVTNADGYPGSSYFKITIAGTGRALTTTAEGELITLPDFTGEPQQLWRLDQLTDGSWRIAHHQAGQLVARRQTSRRSRRPPSSRLN